jgi:hypothetical protein
LVDDRVASSRTQVVRFNSQICFLANQGRLDRDASGMKNAIVCAAPLRARSKKNRYKQRGMFTARIVSGLLLLLITRTEPPSASPSLRVTIPLPIPHAALAARMRADAREGDTPSPGRKHWR